MTPGVFLKGFATTGSADPLVVTLESGPTTDTHFPSSLGTNLESINLPANMFLNCGPELNATGEQGKTPWELPHWVWLPFSTTRTLIAGNQYSLRIRATGAASVVFGSGGRADNHDFLPEGRTLTWAQWAAQRKVSREAFEDCRDGPEYSSNGGSTWQGTGGLLPLGVWFKRIP